MAHFAVFADFSLMLTDGWTDIRTDIRTDTPSYRDATAHLKKQQTNKKKGEEEEEEKVAKKKKTKPNKKTKNLACRRNMKDELVA